jgi:hypothetical protein
MAVLNLPPKSRRGKRLWPLFSFSAAEKVDLIDFQTILWQIYLTGLWLAVKFNLSQNRAKEVGHEKGK